MKPPMQVNAKNKTRLANIRKEHQEFESINDQNRNPNVLMQPGGLRSRKQTQSKGPTMFRGN